MLTIERDNGRNYKFNGEQVAFAQSSMNKAMGRSWSGETGREDRYALYKTSGGNYVCHIHHVTCWEGEKDRNEAKLCKTLDEVFDFFGGGWIAKELYAVAGLEFTEEVA